MDEFFEIVAKVTVLVFVVSCMATAGLGLSVRDMVGPLRRPRLLMLALAANFGIAPAAAYGLTSVFALDPPYAAGLLLLSAAAGAPFLPKLAELAKGDVAYAVGLMLLLTIGTVVFLPILLPLLVPGRSANPWPILRPLFLTMLLPLAVGVMVRARSEAWASRIRPVCGMVSSISMVLAVVVLVGLYFPAMIGTFGSGAVAVAVLFVAFLLASGFLLGGPLPGMQSVLGLGTGQRNIAAALIVATQNSEDPKVVVMLIASTLAGLLVLVPAAVWLGRRSLSAKTDRFKLPPIHEEAPR